MKYYLIAGERSGDLHGSNLIRALKEQDPDAEFRFWGGDYMAAQSDGLVKHYQDIAIMGLFEVLLNFRKLQRVFRACKQDIIEYQPDALILIDFGGFNLRIAKYAHRQGLKVFYYITPKVWAWNTSRAWKIKKYVDHMFVILPFEKTFYQKFDWDVDYVGNPVLDAVQNHEPDQQFIDSLHQDNRPVIAVLPGSRKQEVQRMLPVMTEVFEHFPNHRFIIAAVSSLPPSMYNDIANAELYIDKTYDILSAAKAAIVTSGTATLETALWGVPQVVGYIAGSITYFIGSRLVDIKYFSLVNLITDQPVVRELLQHQCTSAEIIHELEQLLTDDSPRCQEVKAGYQQLRTILGEENASDNTARLIQKYLVG